MAWFFTTSEAPAPEAGPAEELAAACSGWCGFRLVGVADFFFLPFLFLFFLEAPPPLCHHHDQQQLSSRWVGPEEEDCPWMIHDPGLPLHHRMSHPLHHHVAATWFQGTTTRSTLCQPLLGGLQFHATVATPQMILRVCPKLAIQHEATSEHHLVCGPPAWCGSGSTKVQTTHVACLHIRWLHCHLHTMPWCTEVLHDGVSKLLKLNGGRVCSYTRASPFWWQTSKKHAQIKKVGTLTFNRMNHIQHQLHQHAENVATRQGRFNRNFKNISYSCQFKHSDMLSDLCIYVLRQPVWHLRESLCITERSAHQQDRLDVWLKCLRINCVPYVCSFMSCSNKAVSAFQRLSSACRPEHEKGNSIVFWWRMLHMAVPDVRMLL